MKRITYRHLNGEWGIQGVDLTQLPPKVYGALCKLRDIEDLLEAIQDPEITDQTACVLKDELLRVGQ